MNEIPVNEGQEKVVAFQMDLQMFADEAVIDSGGEVGSVDTGADSLGADESGSEVTGSGDDVDSGVVDQNGDDVPGEVKGQSAEANRAFAEMRKQKEAAERAAQKAKQEVQAQRDAEYARRFGKSHGILTEQQYWAALDREQQQKEEQARLASEQLPAKVYQELIANGYDPKVAQGLAEVEAQKIRLNQVMQVLEIQRKQETQKEFEARKRQIADGVVSDHEKLVKEFGEAAIPSLDMLDEATVKKMQRGYSLYDAWTTSNLDVVREHAKKAGSAKALKNVNSKNHLKSEKDGGGDFGTEVTLTADQLRVWKAMGYNEKEARKRAAKYAKRGK